MTGIFILSQSERIAYSSENLLHTVSIDHANPISTEAYTG